MHSLGWLKFLLVCKFRLLCITHRAIYRASPKYLANVITLHTTTVYAESKFVVAAHKCWNALTYDIRSTGSEPLFKC